MDTGGDLQAWGDGKGGPINDGFLADVLNGSSVGDAEAGGTGGVVEIGPDDFLIVVGQEPWIGGGQEFVGQGLMVIGIECVEVETSPLLDVRRVGVDQDVGGVGLHGGEEVEAVELGDVDAVAECGYVLDPLDEGRLVVAGRSGRGRRWGGRRGCRSGWCG